MHNIVGKVVDAFKEEPLRPYSEAVISDPGYWIEEIIKDSITYHLPRIKDDLVIDELNVALDILQTSRPVMGKRLAELVDRSEIFILLSEYPEQIKSLLPEELTELSDLSQDFSEQVSRYMERRRLTALSVMAKYGAYLYE